MFKPITREQEPDFSEIDSLLDIAVPSDLQKLLNELGYGYSQRQELLIFGDESSSRPLIEWNRELIQLGIFPPPSDGGPLFLAENCIRAQSGIRRENNKVIYLMFDPNTFESFVIANNEREFLSEISMDKVLITLNGSVYPILDAKGPLKAGYHLAPFVSPMHGGSLNPDNWGLASAKAHMATSFAEFKAINGA
jgi:hypothetical protein